MVWQLTWLEVREISRILRERVGKRIHKVSSWEKGLKFKIGGEWWLYVRPTLFYPTNYSIESKIDMESQFLRKHLSGKKITGIGMVEGERILKVHMGDLSLVFELFPRGNLVLLQKGIVIYSSGKSTRYSQGTEYRDPERREPRRKGKEWEMIARGVPPVYAKKGIGIFQECEGGFICDNWILCKDLGNCRRFPSILEALDYVVETMLAGKKADERKRAMEEQMEKLEEEIATLEKLINYIYENLDEAKEIIERGGKMDGLEVENLGDRKRIKFTAL